MDNVFKGDFTKSGRIPEEEITDLDPLDLMDLEEDLESACYGTRGEKVKTIKKFGYSTDESEIYCPHLEG